MSISGGGKCGVVYAVSGGRGMAGAWNPVSHPVLSGHARMRCEALLAAIEEVEKKFGMRLSINPRQPTRLEYKNNVQRMVDERGMIHEIETWERVDFESNELGQSFEEYVSENLGVGHE